MNNPRQNLLLLVVSVLFSVLLAEIVLRIVLPAPIVWVYPQENYLFDSEAGHRLEENQHAFTHDKPVDINSQGIRDLEYRQDAAHGMYRIVALGDSQTFGNGLEISDTWPKQLERLLNQGVGNIGFEVLNAGIPATDTWQHEIMMRRMTTHYNPDAVVLALYVNDIVKKPGNIALSKSSDRNTMMSRLIYFVKKSTLMLALREAFYAMKRLFFPNKWFLQQDAILRGESDLDIEARWQQVEQFISAMKETAQRENVGFIVVSIPRRDQVSGRFPAEKYSVQLSAVMKRAGVRFMNLLAPLQQAYKEHGKALFIPWDGHNTAIANRIIAGEIAAAIPGLKVGGPEQSALSGNDGDS